MKSNTIPKENIVSRSLITVILTLLFAIAVAKFAPTLLPSNKNPENNQYALAMAPNNSSNSSDAVPSGVSIDKARWDSLLDDEKNTITVYAHAGPSVVNVTSIANMAIRKSLWEAEIIEVPQGAGSGFVWNSDGYIVTNFHVVASSEKFLISFNKDKKQYAAVKVGVSPRKDIAVLKLEERPATLVPINASTSKNLLVGQKVIAIGNPFGLDHTMTTGIVSALERKIEGIGGVKIDGMIQTDASINPGNSGGPLLDSQGRLIGMNTMIFSRSGTSAGVGFAVPVDTINNVVPQLIKHGKETRPGLGISLVPDYYKERLGIAKGIIVSSVSKSSSATKAGLKGITIDRYGEPHIGDIITAVNNEAVNSIDDIYLALDKLKVGDTVEVTILRDHKELKLKIKLIALTD
ncbi:MAG: trypsin-like peptidase domain-containing protein [Oligoflexia bacterium]|nr:trypsin-like peptidase domain-containing protein [Oligoflexia bacterium]